MPQNKRRFQWHQRTCMLRNQARCVVRNRATRRNRNTVGEGVCRSDQAFTAIHSLRGRSPIFLRIRVQLDSHCTGIDIIQKNLNLKNILPALLLNGRWAESQRGPMFRQSGLPGHEIGSH